MDFPDFYVGDMKISYLESRCSSKLTALPEIANSSADKININTTNANKSILKMD
jgi:hypothetical protein